MNEYKPGQLYTTLKDTPCVMFDDNEKPFESVLVEKGTALLLLTPPFERRFNAVHLSFKRSVKMLYGFHFPSSNPKKIMCCTRFLHKDKIVEVASIKYFIMKDYLLELSSAVRLIA